MTSRRRRRSPQTLLVLIGIAASLTFGACVAIERGDAKTEHGDGKTERGDAKTERGDLKSGAPDPPPIDPARVTAVLINGGGDRESNYLSHVVHLREMLDVLAAAGVPAARTTIFASDGEAPGADLAELSGDQPPDAWLLEDTSIGAWLDPGIRYVSTRIEGHHLRPATRASLRSWFDREGRRLGPGDVLLLFVTDHGSGGKKGPRDNEITLWGDHEALTVDELDALLAKLRPQVRVVTVMSQCYSGGFAYLASDMPAPGKPAKPLACGYFSTTANRQAYGCYPENRGVENVGYAVRVIESLADTGSLPDAHRHALVNDQTPDVPMRTSDVYLIERLRRVTSRSGKDVDGSADQLLTRTPATGALAASVSALSGQIAATYGLAQPTSLAELRTQVARVTDAAEDADAYARAWRSPVGELAAINLDHFIATHPGWKRRLGPERLRTLDAVRARALRSELLAALAAATPEATKSRLRTLEERADAAEGLAYRMRVREAALQRIRVSMLREAGERQLQSSGSPAERSYFAALSACEDLDLPIASAVAAPTHRIRRAPLPSLAADLAEAGTLRPAWMGIQYGSGDRPGTARVERVVPGSPAERAGIRPGDLILGPAGAPFTETGQIREWTMLAQVDHPYAVEVMRQGRMTQRTLVLTPHPGHAAR